MAKIRGWDRVYKGKPTKGIGRRRPTVMHWQSVFGDEVRVEKYHKFDDKQIVEYFDEDEIPEGRDKWVAVLEGGRELYYEKRKDAVDAARAFMRAAYTEEDLRAARHNERRSKNIEEQDMEVDPDDFEPQIA